eukprot:TRINITY_DN1165_c0_g1_i2.p1 TRINITY_DN1165_c0_g1~~TRINITY_DN1165_c0_g1_i2.p1  ORF type:complete len:359 (+),score=205.57 TRINITY_DN1165_c0_g1_i2:51-1079(+)
MLAATLSGFGPISVLNLSTIEKPIIKAGEVLVKVKATAVNRADLLQREGRYPPPPGASSILGLEIAGEIAEFDETNIPNFNKEKIFVGKKVMALISGGGYAEYVAVPAELLLSIPTSFSFDKAAAIPEAYLTAFQALHWLGEVEQKEKMNSNRKLNILIHAGGSSVGVSATQLMKIRGHKVIVTAGSEEKLEKCQKIAGADVAINYKQGDFSIKVLEATEQKGVDILLDFVGAPYWQQNIQSLGFEGTMIILGLLGGGNITTEFNMSSILAKRLQIKGSTLRTRSNEYKEQLSKEFWQIYGNYFESGQLSPIIDRVLTLNQVQEAHQIVADNQNFGKVIMTI